MGIADATIALSIVCKISNTSVYIQVSQCAENNILYMSVQQQRFSVRSMHQCKKVRSALDVIKDK